MTYSEKFFPLAWKSECDLMHVSPGCTLLVPPVLILQFTSSICIPRRFADIVRMMANVCMCLSVRTWPGSWRQLVILPAAIFTPASSSSSSSDHFSGAGKLSNIVPGELELEVESSIFQQQSFLSASRGGTFAYKKIELHRVPKDCIE